MSTADLVDLVNEDQGVLGPDLLQSLNGLSRHCSDIGASVTLDLSDVGEAAHGESGSVLESDASY